MAEVADLQKHGDRYLIDETTAVVRFIFPCGEATRRRTPVSGADFEDEHYEVPEGEPHKNSGDSIPISINELV